MDEDPRASTVRILRAMAARWERCATTALDYGQFGLAVSRAATYREYAAAYREYAAAYREYAAACRDKADKVEAGETIEN